MDNKKKRKEYNRSYYLKNRTSPNLYNKKDSIPLFNIKVEFKTVILNFL